MQNKARDVLKDLNLSLTKTRLAVLSLFLESKKPLSIFDFKKLADLKGVNDSSIYRNLSKLEEVGLIHTVPSSNDFQSYELSAHGEHHHHIICVSCKKLKCLHECGLDEQFRKMAKKQGFELKGHTLELHGLCEDCR